MSNIPISTTETLQVKIEQVIGTLRLLSTLQNNDERRIIWDDTVKDNNDSNKKKSKVCCIYNKPKGFDESSDESSSDCDSNDESYRPNTYERIKKKTCEF